MHACLSRWRSQAGGVDDKFSPDDRSDGHLHMIYSCNGQQDPGLVLKNIKSFTAIKLIDAIVNNPKESRKEYLLNLFEAEGEKSSSNFRFKFWIHENHPELLDSDDV